MVIFTHSLANCVAYNLFMTAHCTLPIFFRSIKLNRNHETVYLIYHDLENTLSLSFFSRLQMDQIGMIKELELCT